MQDLVVRVAFILGNVTARDESSRQSLISHENHLNIILDVLHYYFDADLKVSLSLLELHYNLV